MYRVLGWSLGERAGKMYRCLHVAPPHLRTRYIGPSISIVSLIILLDEDWKQIGNFLLYESEYVSYAVQERFCAKVAHQQARH